MKEERLINIVNHAIETKAANYDTSTKYLKNDTPLTVQILSSDNSFTANDGYHSIPCKFSKGALFWFKMSNGNMSTSELKSKCIVLHEYAISSNLVTQTEVELYLVIYSFSLLPDNEVIYNTSRIKEISKETKINRAMEVLRMSHLREALATKKNDLPDLEAILRGKKIRKGTKALISGLKNTSKESKLKSESSRIIEPKDLQVIEKNMNEDIKFLLQGNESNKTKQDIYNEMVAKYQHLIKDKSLVRMLKERRALEKQSSSKLRKGKRKRPEAIKEDKVEKSVSTSAKKGRKLKKKGKKRRK